MEAWVYLGLPYDDVWNRTFDEYDRIVGALQRRRDDDLRRSRVLNQELATLVAYAFHNPKKMPDLTKGGKSANRRHLTQQEGRAQLRSALLGFMARHNAGLKKKR